MQREILRIYEQARTHQFPSVQEASKTLYDSSWIEAHARSDISDEAFDALLEDL